MTREADVVRSLVEMAGTLVDDYDVVDLLTGLTDRCVDLLGVSAAGVMLASPAGSLGLVASSSEAMRLLELFELQAQEGPCLDAFRTGPRARSAGQPRRSRQRGCRPSRPLIASRRLLRTSPLTSCTPGSPSRPPGTRPDRDPGRGIHPASGLSPPDCAG